MKLLISALVAFGLATPVLAEEWTMSTNEPEGNYHTQNTLKFAEDVARLSDGELTIKVVSNAALLKRPETKRGLQSGVVPIAEVLISTLGSDDKAFEADAVPLLATTFEDAKSLWNASKDVYSGKLAEQGLVMLYSVPWPPQGVYMHAPVNSAADFAGVKFRAYNASTSRLVELLGATPTTVASTEISQAFSTGIITGMITSPTTGVDTQAWDFVKNYYDVKAFIPKNFALVSKAAFEKLSPKTQDAVMEATRLAEVRGWAAAEEATAAATQTLVDNGMNVSATPADLAADLKVIGATMLSEWLEQAGDDAAGIVKTYKAK